MAGGQASLLDRKSSFGSGGIKGRAMAPGAAGVMKQGSSYGSGLMADNNNPAGADIDESYEEQPDTEVSQQQQNDARGHSEILLEISCPECARNGWSPLEL